MIHTIKSKPNSNGVTFAITSNEFIPSETIIGRLWGCDSIISETPHVKVLLRKNSIVKVGSYIGDYNGYLNKIIGISVKGKDKKSYRPRKATTDWDVTLYLENKLSIHTDEVGYIYSERPQPKTISEFRTGKSPSI